MDELTHVPTSLAEAMARDSNDPLGGLKSRFDLPDGEIYLVGHSLGPPSKSARSALCAAQDVWGQDIVGAWNSAGWIDFPKTVGARVARLIGVAETDVVLCDSVSVNLHKLVGALVSRVGTSARIIVEAGEFPTDQYILERLAGLTGCRFARAAPGTGVDHLDEGVVLVRSLVDYRTAFVADVPTVERKAGDVGADVVWDLSHATGVLDLRLAEWGVRYAVGCTYKYLCGGPGAPAFIYTASTVANDLRSSIEGWLGHARPFAFENDYVPADGVERFVAGTPPILSMAALNGALEIFEHIDPSLLEAKARRLGDMCLLAFERLGLESNSPAVGERRGGHVALNHPRAYAVSRALAERGVRSDFRPPSTLRFGLSPLYLGYADVWRALAELEDVLKTEIYLEPRFSITQKVT